MEEKFSWTVDVETDQGGRSWSKVGITEGLPRIFRLFKDHRIRALFFVSSELVFKDKSLLEQIKGEGHDVGSHGHFHIPFKDRWRAEQDYQISYTLLDKPFYHRAPKFSWNRDASRYSSRKDHVGLLRYTWGLDRIPEDPIFYLHPFDIVESKEPAPNIFCKLWYSRPRKAYETLTDLVTRYPGSCRLS